MNCHSHKEQTKRPTVGRGVPRVARWTCKQKYRVALTLLGCPRPYLQACRWKKWKLAYMYADVKSKYFNSGICRACLKDCHACCRCVASWAAHPCKRLYKSRARGLEAGPGVKGLKHMTCSLPSVTCALRTPLLPIGGVLSKRASARLYWMFLKRIGSTLPTCDAPP